MKMKFETIEIGQRLKNGAIVISVTKKGNRAIILAMVPKAYEPYITWCKEDSYIMWGHYFGDLELALKDYKSRVAGGY